MRHSLGYELRLLIAQGLIGLALRVTPDGPERVALAVGILVWASARDAADAA